MLFRHHRCYPERHWPRNAWHSSDRPSLDEKKSAVYSAYLFDMNSIKCSLLSEMGVELMVGPDLVLHLMHWRCNMLASLTICFVAASLCMPTSHAVLCHRDLCMTTEQAAFSRVLQV